MLHKTSVGQAIALSLLAIATVLSGCSTPLRRAPVEDRKPAPHATSPITPAPTADSAPVAPAADAGKPPLPGAENAGKPGYYTVKPGDTLIKIGLEAGQPWRDVARWNALDNPDLIEVGQVLRVVPPGVDANAAGTRPVAQSRVEVRPLDAARPAASAASSASGVATGASAPAAAASAPANDDDVAWTWPAAGPVAVAFNDTHNKGLGITGKLGDPVLAAADGRVVYAGAGLRGYGNLVILKHNNTYLTAYAHNQTLLVKEDQVVRRGQKIAEMGSSDADRVQLHFEIRRLGKPIDPAKLLPAR